MTPVILAMTLAAALAAHWIVDVYDCLFVSPGTDYCLDCGEDCLEPIKEGNTP